MKRPHTCGTNRSVEHRLFWANFSPKGPSSVWGLLPTLDWWFQALRDVGVQFFLSNSSQISFQKVDWMRTAIVPASHHPLWRACRCPRRPAWCSIVPPPGLGCCTHGMEGPLRRFVQDYRGGPHMRSLISIDFRPQKWNLKAHMWYNLAPMWRLRCSTTQATFTNPSLLRAAPLLRAMFSFNHPM